MLHMQIYFHLISDRNWNSKKKSAKRSCKSDRTHTADVFSQVPPNVLQMAIAWSKKKKWTHSKSNFLLERLFSRFAILISKWSKILLFTHTHTRFLNPMLFPSLKKKKAELDWHSCAWLKEKRRIFFIMGKSWASLHRSVSQTIYSTFLSVEKEEADWIWKDIAVIPFLLQQRKIK